MKKILFLIFTSVILSASCFASDVYFSSSPFTFSNPEGNLNTTASTASDSAPCYFWLRYTNSANTELRVWAISTEQGAHGNITGVNSAGNNVTQTFTCNLATGDYYSGGVEFVSGADITNMTTSNSLSVFPYNTDLSAVASAFEAYLANPPIPTPSVKSTFALPCGNVAYFQVSSGQTVDFKSSYQILSSPFANSTYGYWSDSGQRFGPAASLPSSSTSFPIASQDPLYWTPDPQSKNLLGLSKTGLASASCIIGQWYAFYNPAYNSNNTDWTTMDITGATVLISGSFSAIKIFPLEQVVDYQNGAFVGGSNDDYQSYFDGNIGADGSVSFTNQDGESSVPTAGGQNLLAPNETAQSLIEKVVEILQNLLSEIQSLFTFGYDAIQSLVGIMSSFVSSFSQLYTWLPTEVYSALISAVIIAVVIGIFKVFL